MTLYTVDKTSKPAQPQRSGCCGCMIKCLPTLITFVVFVASVVTCCVILGHAALRTNSLLKNNGTYMYYIMEHVPLVCRIIIAVMVTTGLLVLGTSAISMYYPGRCAWVMSVMSLFLLILFQLVWILITSAAAMPIAMFIGLKIFYQMVEKTRVNLKNFYAMVLVTDQEYKRQGDKLSEMTEECDDVFVLYLIAFISAVIICMCLTFFIMSTVANFTRLKQKRKHMAKGKSITLNERFVPTQNDAEDGLLSKKF